MEQQTINKIKSMKGMHFTTDFIIDFEIQWNETVSKIKKLGANLSAIYISCEGKK